MSKAQTKKDLAEAGRRKLEAFRKQKAEKKQPSKAAPSDESTTANLGRPSGSVPEAVGLSASKDRGSSEQQSAASLSSGNLFTTDNVATPSPAFEHVPEPSLAQNGHNNHITGSRSQQPSESAASGDDNPAPVDAMPAESEEPAPKQRTARSLFSAGLPAPPPLPLPPTPISRPPWMSARATMDSRASPQPKPSQPPTLEGSIPFGATNVAASDVAHSPQQPADPAAPTLMPAAQAEPLTLSLVAPPFISNGTEDADAALHLGHLSLSTSSRQDSSAAGFRLGQQQEQTLSSMSPVRTGERPAAVLHASPARAEHRDAARPVQASMTAEEEDAEASWDALLARPLPPRASKHRAQEQASSASDMQQTVQQVPEAADHPGNTAQPATSSVKGAAGYASLSDAYASIQQVQPAEQSGQATPAASHALLSDVYAASKQAVPEVKHPNSSPAADYAHLSDEYLGGSGSGTALSGPPPRAEGVGTHPDSLNSGIAGSSHGYAALSDSYLSPSALEPRISGALPVSSNAATGPPSHSNLDPIEQRQLGTLPASMTAGSTAPSQLALDPSAQAPKSPYPESAPATKSSADIRDKGTPSLWSAGMSQLDSTQSASAAPPRSFYGSWGTNTKTDSGIASPTRSWHEPMEPPPSRFQRPSWVTSDSKEDTLGGVEQSAQDSSKAGLSQMTSGDNRLSELSNGHAAGVLKSTAGNGIPPRRSWSRETWDSRGPAVPSPPVSVRGTASEEGFSASEGQMKRFKALQEHIDELTREKYELLRGLATQRKVQESLEEESERFASDFNRQAQHTQALQKQLDQLSAEVAAQRLALAAATSERDGARAAAFETSERLGRLAAEVVELEEKALKAKSEELKREREAAAEREAARRAQSAAKAAQQERETLQSILDTLEEEKRVLHIKLRRAMLGTHLREEQGNKEASTQTDRLPAEAGTPPPLRSQASAQTPRQRAQSVLQTQPKEDPSVQITAEAMQAFGAESAQEAAPGALPEAVLQLLPRNLYTGGLAGKESDVAADEAAALSNIHGLMDSLEKQRQSMLASRDATEAENKKLMSANRDLSQRLESAQQRLELAISRSHQALTQPPPPLAAAAGHPASPQALPESKGRHATLDGAGAQLVMQSAPNTPAQPSRQLLRAPKGGEARRSTLGWFVDLLVPPSQDFQRIGPLT